MVISPKDSAVKDMLLSGLEFCILMDGPSSEQPGSGDHHFLNSLLASSTTIRNLGVIPSLVLRRTSPDSVRGCSATTSLFPVPSMPLK